MSTPRPWRLVAAREMGVKLRNRNFLITTLITVLILPLSMMLPMLMADRATGETYRVAVTDADAKAVVEHAASESPEPVLEVATVADRAAADQAVRAGDVDGALIGEPGKWSLVTEGSPPMALSATLSGAVESMALARNAAAAGTNIEKLNTGGELALVDIDRGAQSGGLGDLLGLVGGMVFALLFYLSAVMFGTQIASSVVEEKQSRIIEILAASIPLRQLLLGKIVGNTLIAFGQILLICLTMTLSFVGMTAMLIASVSDAPTDAGGASDASSVGAEVLAGFDMSGALTAMLWYVPFFVLGFVALSCVWAAVGALCSRTEDLQSTSLPVTMGLLAVFFAGITASGTVEKVLSYVPIMSTVVMPGRILAGDYLWWEPLISLVLVAAFCALAVAWGARLYERAVLHTGGSLTWRQALRLRA